MKSIFFYFCLLLTLIFSGCTKKVTHSERFNNLIGEWHLTANGQDLNHNGVLDDSEIVPKPDSVVIVAVYFANGTGYTNLTISGQSFSNTTINWLLLDQDRVYREIANPNSSVTTTNDFRIQTLSSTTFIYPVPTSMSDTNYEVFTKQ
ncbi:MAG: hypothetical protein ABI378_13620 [Chitinophagaceae bacterium]